LGCGGDTFGVGPNDDANDRERLYAFVTATSDDLPALDLDRTLSVALEVDVARRGFWAALAVVTELERGAEAFTGTLDLDPVEFEGLLDAAMVALRFEDVPAAYFSLCLTLAAIERAARELPGAAAVDVVLAVRDLTATLAADADTLQGSLDAIFASFDQLADPPQPPDAAPAPSSRES